VKRGGAGRARDPLERIALEIPSRPGTGGRAEQLTGGRVLCVATLMLRCGSVHGRDRLEQGSHGPLERLAMGYAAGTTPRGIACRCLVHIADGLHRGRVGARSAAS
jgi:hypothetical protein